MIRELFHIGPLSISPFGLLMVLAFVAGSFQLRWGLRRLEAGDDEDAAALILAAGIGGLVGAKIYYAALYGDWHLLFDRSGLVWYGGLILGTLAVLWTIRRRRLPAWSSVDAGAATLTLGYGIGRVGCFLVGDDYGLPTALPWGIKIPYGLPGPTSAGFMRSEFGAAVSFDVPAEQLIPVHPTQLYETIAALAIWALGAQLIRRRAAPGIPALAVLALLAVERFGVEFLRAKDDRFFGPFTLAQAISVAVVLALVVIWLRRREAAD
ncbi:MAG: prolipoprotein diacylglyceryl transferase family protein [Thermoanaerobaculia bacterium]